jgi:hypothetical protein
MIHHRQNLLEFINFITTNISDWWTPASIFSSSFFIDEQTSRLCAWHEMKDDGGESY